MAFTLFAAISVGSYELEMKIFEISAKNGMKEIDRVAHIIELGKETYNYQKISFELVDEMCNVLYDFSKIMKTYNVKAYKAYANSAIREAVNARSILDRIKVKTGIDVEILSNSEQRFLTYKAVAVNEKSFDNIIENGTIIIDMGAGSAQVTLFDKGELITTQNLRLGALRMREMLGKFANDADNYKEMLGEYIDNDCDTLKNIFIKDRAIRNIIGVGENTVSIRVLKNIIGEEKFSKEKFTAKYNSIINYTEEQFSVEFDMPQEQTSLIIPTMILLGRIMEYTGADTLFTPNVKLCDGMAVEYAEYHRLLKIKRDFTDDIISEVKVISKRYQCNKEHINNVSDNALTIFDGMKKIHGLSDRYRLLLQIASFLHDVGKYISLVYPTEAAFNIIMATEILGISHKERLMIAQIVKFNTMDFEYDNNTTAILDSDIYMNVMKLTAILRVANALDRSHMQKNNSISVAIDDNIVKLITDTYEDITLEKGLFGEKSEFFEEVYGLKPVIKQKKN